MIIRCAITISVLLSLCSCSTVKKQCPDAIGVNCTMLSCVGKMTDQGTIDIFYNCKDGVCNKRTKAAILKKAKEISKKLERSYE